MGVAFGRGSRWYGALPHRATTSRTRNACARAQYDPQAVLDFIAAIPACEAELASYHQDGNREILGALDEFLDKAAAGVI